VCFFLFHQHHKSSTRFIEIYNPVLKRGKTVDINFCFDILIEDMKRLTLPSGMNYGYDLLGQRICIGAQMGRRTILPDDRTAPIKIQLEKVPFVDGAYDRWGAYWGAPNNLYCAWTETVQVFVRANDREQAKTEVRETLPNARFYR
jgi:hypothetical protein